MKDIKEFINEAVEQEISFNSYKFKMDHIIGANVHTDIDQARTVERITDEMWKDLKKQGVKYVLCFPPHLTQSDEKVDNFMIKMFIKSKKLSDGYNNTEMYALYDVKTHECVNKDILDKRGAYKVLRYE